MYLSLVPQLFLSPAGALLLTALVVLELALLRLVGDRVQGRLLGLVALRPHLRLMVYPLIAPGVVLHELAHALAALAAGAGIRKLVLFWPRQQADGRVILGYVIPRFQPRLPGGRALIALAPLLLPPLLLYALAPVMIPTLDGLEPPQRIFQAAAQQPTLWGSLWLFLFASMTLANFPSDADFNALGASRLPLLALFFGLPLTLALLEPDWLATGLAAYLALALFLLPSLLIALVAALVLAWLERGA